MKSLLPPLAAWIVFCLVAVVSALYAPPLLNPDSAVGMVAWNSWTAGGPWNSVPSLDPSDISRDVFSFVTWWSPGQQIVPGLLSKTMSLTWALVCTQALGVAAMGAGMIFLARTIGLTREMSAWSATAAILAWRSFYGLSFFTGGDILQAAWFPWVAAFGFRIRKRPVAQTAAMFALLFAGLFAKHSFLIWGLVIVIWLAWDVWKTQDNSPLTKWLQTAGLLAAWVCSRLAASALWIRGGQTPSLGSHWFEHWSSDLGYSLLAPWLEATGMESLLGRTAFLLGLNPEEFWRRFNVPTLFLGLLLAATGLVLARHIRVLPLRRLFLLVVLLVPAFFFGVYASGSGTVSQNARHFPPAGLVMLLTGGYFAGSVGFPVRLAARALLASICLYGIASVGARFPGQRSLPHFRSGIGQGDMNRDVFEFVEELGKTAPHDKVLLFSNVAPTLEFADWRVGAPEAAILKDPAFLREFRGRVSLLVLAFPEHLEENGIAAAIRASFVDYSEWRRRDFPGWKVWWATSQ